MSKIKMVSKFAFVFSALCLSSLGWSQNVEQGVVKAILKTGVLVRVTCHNSDERNPVTPQPPPCDRESGDPKWAKFVSYDEKFSVPPFIDIKISSGQPPPAPIVIGHQLTYTLRVLPANAAEVGGTGAFPVGNAEQVINVPVDQVFKPGPTANVLVQGKEVTGAIFTFTCMYQTPSPKIPCNTGTGGVRSDEPVFVANGDKYPSKIWGEIPVDNATSGRSKSDGNFFYDLKVTHTTVIQFSGTPLRVSNQLAFIEGIPKDQVFKVK